MSVYLITECLEVGRDVHLPRARVLRPAGLARLVHGPGHGHHHAGALGLRLDNGHPVLALVLAALDAAELVLDVGHVLVHVGADLDAGLVTRARDHAHHAGVLAVPGLHLVLLSLQGGLHRSPGIREVRELRGVTSVDRDREVRGPGPVARRPGDHLMGDLVSRDAEAISHEISRAVEAQRPVSGAPVGGGRGHNWGGRGQRRAPTAVHQQQPQPVLLHAGLVRGGRGSVLELCVHHPRVGVGRGPVTPGVAGGPGQEPAVIVVTEASEAEHGATRGPVLRGQPPGYPRHGDQDDADTWKQNS